jgi:hypothetical protein
MWLWGKDDLNKVLLLEKLLVLYYRGQFRVVWFVFEMGLLYLLLTGMVKMCKVLLRLGLLLEA